MGRDRNRRAMIPGIEMRITLVADIGVLLEQPFILNNEAEQENSS